MIYERGATEVVAHPAYIYSCMRTLASGRRVHEISRMESTCGTCIIRD